MGRWVILWHVGFLDSPCCDQHAFIGWLCNGNEIPKMSVRYGCETSGIGESPIIAIGNPSWSTEVEQSVVLM